MIKRRPQPDECAPYYHRYIDKVKGDDLLAILQKNRSQTVRFLKKMDAARWNFAYAPGKWTVKEVALHMIDAERIFAYRALRIARNDATPLPGFDENAFVPFSGAAQRSPESLIEEFKSVREATIHLFKNFTDDMWPRRGTASDNPVTPLACGFIIAGHTQHHLGVLKERYLSNS